VNASDINIFLSDTAWAICSTHHTVLKASPGAAIFGRDMPFDILSIADWKKIGEHRQRLTDLNTAHENEGRIDYDYKVGQKILERNKGILRKAEWTITTVLTNGTIMIQHESKEERLNIRRVKLFEE
jgi:flagellar biosynthesis/type III secretory pathway chaperone